jgi:glycosyltransferase involved in cell wall biosynthesis
LRDVALARWRLPAAGVHLIPNGVDVARYAGARRREGPGVVVGSLGALRAEKNYARLVRAVAAAGPDLRLVLYGEGDQRQAIARAAEEAGFKGLSLAGATAAPEEALKGFDIFALSSDTEQMPLSLMEAMAAGLPVAATDVGDIAAMVSPKNRGFITPAGDEAALSAAIRRLAGDPGLRAVVGEANRAKARAVFGLDRMTAAHLSLYRDVARKA